MNREIKFKGWIVELQKMIDPNKQPFSIYNNGDYLMGHIQLEQGGKYYNVELIEYTGKQDKNGKDIYEGDIVKRNNPFFNAKTDTVDNKTEITVIEFRNDYFNQGFVTREAHIDISGELHDWDWSNDCEGFEVIGNIYENHELLSA